MLRIFYGSNLSQVVAAPLFIWVALLAVAVGIWFDAAALVGTLVATAFMALSNADGEAQSASAFGGRAMGRML